MKSDEKKPADSGSEKQPQKPSDILLDTKTTEPPPSPGQAELKQAQDLIAAGKYTDAIEPLKKSIKLFPALPSTDSAPAHYELGIAYRMLNRLDDAIKEFTEALKVDPAIPDAMLRRGICWYYKDEYSLAQADFDEAAGANNNDPRPLTWKGMTLVKLGQVRDAITAYSEALRYDSRYAPAHVNRGLAYISLREYAKAVADFDQAIRSTPDDASLFYRRGVAQGALGDFRSAVKSYSEAIRINPKYADAYSNRSTAYQRLGDTAKAQADAAHSQELKSSANRAAQSAAR
jgi:tetratricopeptide (TPR) repeat protein